MQTLLFFSSSFMKALAWTFVHSLWQGLLIALFAAIIIYTTRRSAAHLRYNLFGLLILLFLGASAFTFVKEFHAANVPATVNDTILAGTPVSISAAGDISVIEQFTDWIDSHTNLLLPVWAFFFLFNCLKLVSGLLAANRLRYHRTYAAPVEWKKQLDQWSRALGIRSKIELLQSELVKVPAVLGVLKPVILVPVGLMAKLPAEQVEAVLLHELAHIRRKDFLVNFLQHVAEAFFFFNPALLWLSSLVRQEREACCDDIAITATGQKRNYLQALVSFQEYSLNELPHVMAIGSKQYPLLNRIKRMLTNENKTLGVMEKLSLMAGIIILSAFGFINRTNAEAAIIKEDAVVSTIGLTNTETRDPVKIVIRDTVPVRKKPARPAKLKVINKLPTEKQWKEAMPIDTIIIKPVQPKSQEPPAKLSPEQKRERLLEKNERKREKLQENMENKREELQRKFAIERTETQERVENIRREKAAVLRQQMLQIRQIQMAKKDQQLLRKKLEMRTIHATRKIDARIIQFKLSPVMKPSVEMKAPAEIKVNVLSSPAKKEEPAAKASPDKLSNPGGGKPFKKVPGQEVEKKLNEPKAQKAVEQKHVAAAFKVNYSASFNNTFSAASASTSTHEN